MDISFDPNDQLFSHCQGFPIMLWLVYTLSAIATSVIFGLPRTAGKDNCAPCRMVQEIALFFNPVLVGDLANILTLIAQNVTNFNDLTFCRVVVRSRMAQIMNSA
jgi:hypothetical protein